MFENLIYMSSLLSILDNKMFVCDQIKSSFVDNFKPSVGYHTHLSTCVVFGKEYKMDP